MYYSRNDCKALTEEMRQMFPKPLEKMYYNEIIDVIKKDKQYGFRHIALKIMKRNGLEEFYINLKRNNINETILKEIEKEMRGE